MKIIDSIIESLNIEDREIKKVIIGLYTTYVSNNSQAGLSSTLYKSCSSTGYRHDHFIIKDAGMLNDKSGIDLVKYIYSNNIIEASIGMAAINSYIKINREKCLELNAYNIIADKGKNKNIAVIGGFPFVNKLKSIAKKLYVFELFPEFDDELSADKMPEFLPRADVIAITGTSILNHTLEEILKNSDKNSYKIVLGPSTPMTETLFDYGIDSVCGSLVVNSKLVENYITQAVPFKSIKGVRHLTMTK